MIEVSRRQGRKWRFGSAVFDEQRWTLSVDERLVAIEAKPLELLHELLLRANEVVTKNELLDAIWPGVSVVEASLPTAINKLRRALGDEKRDEPVIVTVRGIGYRMGIPVILEGAKSHPSDPPSTIDGPLPPPHRRRSIAVGTLALMALAGALATARAFAPAPAPSPPVSRDEAMEALRALDMPQLRSLLARGWKPSAPLDREGNNALNVVLETCEWNPNHDRRKLLIIVRMLIDHGTRIDVRNTFGDTPYSIAKAPRYCGPDHPATRLLHAICYGGDASPHDGCLATYELDRRRAQRQ